MKRYGLLTILSIVIITSGCSSKESNLFYVMFKDTPDLISDTVYLNGNDIGKILSIQSGFNNITEVKITINNGYIDKMNANVVFCSSNGKLEYITIKGAGGSLSKEAAILGFNSKLSLSWFKIKNTFTNASSVAIKIARELYDKIRWAELKEV
ncbi:hypothetical protein ACFL03_03150 [Thermodesulfobacteriota bacterium]